METKKEVIKERKFKAGYVIRTEVETTIGYQPRTYKWAYNLDGVYIGFPKYAYRLCKIMGIKPEPRKPDHNVCSIGFCEREQKWYGWSHRGMVGFGIGDKFFVEYDWGTDDKPHNPKPVLGKLIETLREAKESAINFAESVS